MGQHGGEYDAVDGHRLAELGQYDMVLHPAGSVPFPAALRMRPSRAAWNWRFHRRATSGRSIATMAPANISTLMTWVPSSGGGGEAPQMTRLDAVAVA